MVKFTEMNAKELEEKKEILLKKYEDFKNMNLKYDMSRGKPCKEQLDLSMKMMEITDYMSSDGVECRNYGGLDGLLEARELFGEILGANADEVLVGGNSALNMIYDTIERAMNFGVLPGEIPWGKLPKVKFLCPSPGYDRHFAICELFGIEMIPIDMNLDGPDIETIEKLVGSDEAIKGIMCVPKYSNPDGITYSDHIVDRLAQMETKAKDFRIIWDNAYVVHDLFGEGDKLKNIFEACKEAGHEDRVFMYISTSKITFPGAGVAAMATSKENLKEIKKKLSIQMIGPDKMNQLRHVRFLKDMEAIEAHMKKHAEIMKPKFSTVLSTLSAELDGKEIAWWNKPNGGYFISLNTLDGCAKEVIKMTADAGVIMTPAGATYPYGNDPRDRNIRIAPSFPSVEELKNAMEVFCTCIQIVSINKLLLK
ncbi:MULTISPECIES: aminotransferase class I/II-fold pyridoxal phosphate-dependent enzyme [Clostridium]|uniref:aminotransferase class I/II-fold pyridoxal phosphate-dependent enzyme n=1 Tax=Clostridium TaxID=1485 RepID=UPI000983C277|nr:MULTISPECIES: aminotransferase class I/II-fold pyridoxal phosphate-dependent enzyme [Clostridium]AQR95965.1 putative aminotransferase [Clostridium saccharoperbutylacetonicum]NSB31832.1 aspartate/methionine/tyrosine aminotransferase [Clostridium saccharoperbutylacetonicum]